MDPSSDDATIQSLHQPQIKLTEFKRFLLVVSMCRCKLALAVSVSVPSDTQCNFSRRFSGRFFVRLVEARGARSNLARNVSPLQCPRLFFTFRQVGSLIRAQLENEE